MRHNRWDTRTTENLFFKTLPQTLSPNMNEKLFSPSRLHPRSDRSAGSCRQDLRVVSMTTGQCEVSHLWPGGHVVCPHRSQSLKSPTLHIITDTLKLYSVCACVCVCVCVLTPGGGKGGGGWQALCAAQLAGDGDGVGGGTFQAAQLLLGCVSRHGDAQCWPWANGTNSCSSYRRFSTNYSGEMVNKIHLNTRCAYGGTIFWLKLGSALS